jgi:hypothetical protein
MMKVPKTDSLEQILDKINTELDYDRRQLVNSTKGIKGVVGSFGTTSSHIRQGTQTALTSGSINVLTLSLNDMN